MDRKDALEAIHRLPPLSICNISPHPSIHPSMVWVLDGTFQFLSVCEMNPSHRPVTTGAGAAATHPSILGCAWCTYREEDGVLSTYPAEHVYL